MATTRSMSQVPQDQGLRWAQTSVPLSSVVTAGRPCPALIKVARLATTADDQTLHIGQVLEVLGVKHRRCVQGEIHTNNLSKASLTRFGHLRQINIPMDIGWRVNRMSRPELLFPTIRDLVRHFPKKVRATYNHQRDPTSVRIVDPGTILELDRVEGKEIMVASVRGQEVKFPMNYRGDFEEIPDDAQYDFEEVMVRFLCPQWVKFTDDALVKKAIRRFQGFTGEIKLNHWFLQRVLVCRVHGSSTRGNRQVICLPVAYRDNLSEPSFFLCTNTHSLPNAPLDVNLESLYDEINAVNFDWKANLSASCHLPSPPSLSPKLTSPRPKVPPRPEQSPQQRSSKPSSPRPAAPSPTDNHNTASVPSPVESMLATGTSGLGSNLRRNPQAPGPPRPVSKYPPDLDIPPPRPDTARPTSDPTFNFKQDERISHHRSQTALQRHKPNYINDKQVDPESGAPIGGVESLHTIISSMQDLSKEVNINPSNSQQTIKPAFGSTSGNRNPSPMSKPKGDDYYFIFDPETDVPPPSPHCTSDTPGYMTMSQQIDDQREDVDSGVNPDHRSSDVSLNESNVPPPVFRHRLTGRESPIDSYITALRIPSRIESETHEPHLSSSSSSLNTSGEKVKPPVPAKKPLPPLPPKKSTREPLPKRPNTLGRDISPSPMTSPSHKKKDTSKSMTYNIPPPSRPVPVPERSPEVGPPTESRHEAGDGATDVHLEHAHSVREIPTQLQELSVRGLAKALRLLKLDRVADTCEHNVVDGQVFLELSEEDLKEEPFCLRGLSLRKVVHLKDKGWRPRVD